MENKQDKICAELSAVFDKIDSISPLVKSFLSLEKQTPVSIFMDCFRTNPNTKEVHFDNKLAEINRIKIEGSVLPLVVIQEIYSHLLANSRFKVDDLIRWIKKHLPQYKIELGKTFDSANLVLWIKKNLPEYKIPSGQVLKAADFFEKNTHIFNIWIFEESLRKTLTSILNSIKDKEFNFLCLSTLSGKALVLDLQMCRGRRFCAVSTCNTSTILFCPNCRIQFYCSREHQKEDWPRHKGACGTCKKKKTRRLLYQVLKEKNIPLIISPSGSQTFALQVYYTSEEEAKAKLERLKKYYTKLETCFL